MKSKNSNINWLGFSLPPRMNMDISIDPQHDHQRQSTADSSAAVPTSYSPSRINNCEVCYSVGVENEGFYSQLSAMPLKFDGYFCTMEALSSSHQEGVLCFSCFFCFFSFFRLNFKKIF